MKNILEISRTIVGKKKLIWFSESAKPDYKTSKNAMKQTQCNNTFCPH